MISPESRNNLVLLAIGLLVLLGPVVILVATLGVLTLLGDLALDRITLVEFLELYIVDLILFVGFGYGIYRLTLWVVEHRLPTRSDRSDASEATEPEASGDDRYE